MAKLLRVSLVLALILSTVGESSSFAMRRLFAKVLNSNSTKELSSSAQRAFAGNALRRPSPLLSASLAPVQFSEPGSVRHFASTAFKIGETNLVVKCSEQKCKTTELRNGQIRSYSKSFLYDLIENGYVAFLPAGDSKQKALDDIKSRFPYISMKGKTSLDTVKNERKWGYTQNYLLVVLSPKDQERESQVKELEPIAHSLSRKMIYSDSPGKFIAKSKVDTRDAQHTFWKEDTQKEDIDSDCFTFSPKGSPKQHFFMFFEGPISGAW